jgi:hypothetical protein
MDGCSIAHGEPRDRQTPARSSGVACQNGTALDGPAHGESVYAASAESDAVAFFDRDPLPGR